MRTSTWIQITKTCLLGAAICMCFALWQKMPTKFDRPLLTVNDVIQADISARQGQESFDRVINAINQSEE